MYWCLILSLKKEKEVLSCNFKTIAIVLLFLFLCFSYYCFEGTKKRKSGIRIVRDYLVCLSFFKVCFHIVCIYCFLTPTGCPIIQFISDTNSQSKRRPHRLKAQSQEDCHHSEASHKSVPRLPTPLPTWLQIRRVPMTPSPHLRFHNFVEQPMELWTHASALFRIPTLYATQEKPNWSDL